jgi:enamine deaminase RidA (YjgF/YER057c/UK114 family)
MNPSHPIDDRLAALGLALPEPPSPVAAYIPAVRSGSLLFVSGQLPVRAGELIATGRVPSGVSIESAQAGAKQAVLNALAIVHHHLGGNWSKLNRIVRLGVFVQSDDGFADQPRVANGASELLVELLGESGRHARAAVGVNALPLDAAVELELLAELAD